MPTVDLPTRVANKIRLECNNCWVWAGAVTDNGGYGKLTINGRTWRAHRYIWMDHLCKNPPCVNPDHLEVVDQRTNTLRSTNHVAAQARQTHCKRGHPLDAENTRIDRRGLRVCRECAHAHALEYYNEVWKRRHTNKWGGKTLYRPRRATLTRYGLIEERPNGD